MEKQIIINAFYDSIVKKETISKKVFGNKPIPTNIENVVLALSSLDYIDLLIDVEKLLGIEIPEESASTLKVSIGELAERIQKSV